MNKRYLMKAVACIWLMTMLSITGCGQKAATEGNTETQTQTEAERVDTGFVVTNPDSYDSADTAVLVDINEIDKTVTLLNLDICRRYTLSMDGTTRFGDKYGKAISLDQLQEGDIVDVTFLKTQKHLTSMQLAQTAWQYDSVERYELNAVRHEVSIGGETYKLSKDTQYFSQGHSIEEIDLNPSDILTFHGIDSTVLSVIVEKGHGYLRLVNDENFVGGWLEIGQTQIVRITEDMLVTVPEGSYQVDAGESALGNITRLENLAEKIPQYLKDEERKLGELKEQFEAAKVQAERPFSEEEKLSELLKEQVSLNLELEFVDADEEGTEKAGKSHGNSIYRKLRKLAPKLFEGTYTYMKFKQDGFDDLVLETIGENEYSIAHYYTQNGDRMRDPEITFMLDDTQRCIYALSYTQDNMGIYYETGDRTEKQMEDLMGFFDQWMANIKEQGFTLYKAYGEDAEYTKEEEHTEEMGYTVISADNLKQMNRFDGEDMENER